MYVSTELRVKLCALYYLVFMCVQHGRKLSLQKEKRDWTIGGLQDALLQR